MFTFVLTCFFAYPWEATVVYEGQYPMSAQFAKGKIVVQEEGTGVPTTIVVKPNGSVVSNTISIGRLVNGNELQWLDDTNRVVKSALLPPDSEPLFSLIGFYKDFAIVRRDRNQLYAVSPNNVNLIYDVDGPIRIIEVSNEGILVCEVSGFVSWIR